MHPRALAPQQKKPAQRESQLEQLEKAWGARRPIVAKNKQTNKKINSDWEGQSPILENLMSKHSIFQKPEVGPFQVPATSWTCGGCGRSPQVGCSPRRGVSKEGTAPPRPRGRLNFQVPRPRIGISSMARSASPPARAAPQGRYPSGRRTGCRQQQRPPGFAGGAKAAEEAKAASTVDTPSCWGRWWFFE